MIRSKFKNSYDNYFCKTPLRGCFCYMAIICNQNWCKVCQVTHIEYVTHALFEPHIKKNTREVSHAFPNICKFLKNLVLRVFLKTSVFYAGNDYSFSEFTLF